MQAEVTGEVWEWRGPAPYHFVTVPPDVAADLQAVGAAASYGWGMLPVRVRLGATTWTTSLWPRDGGYALPLKDAVRRAEGVQLGDTVRVVLEVVSTSTDQPGRRPGRPAGERRRP